jgi:hypothetical protein
MKLILLSLSIFIISCNNPVVPKPIVSKAATPNPELGKKRLAAITLTDFLEIGYKQDTLVESYSTLKYDSIEALNFRYIGMADNFKKDTIFKRHSLNTMQAQQLVEVLDSEKTYDYSGMANCFEPHMIFVFYSQDTIVARCSVCFHCRNLYSTLKSEKRQWQVNLSSFGDKSLGKMCKEFNFSDCK